ncbi:MAG: MgtE protein [Bacilli bacterium]|jgi:flagellar motility protein MotE (MotC chaperone)|nr:MgtE protein [Bacilli bacterium]
MKAEMEEAGLSGFERLLYIFIIPIIFAIILIGVLLSLFDTNIYNDILRQADKIPIIGSILPQPKAEIKTDSTKDVPQEKIKNQDQKITDLNKKIADQETAVKSADDAALAKDQTIKDLQAKSTALEEQLKAKTLSDEEYHTQIKKTADMYAGMNASKSAPIMENLTLQERVLILSQMQQADQVKILEKMDPVKAAEASIALKDVVGAKDREIAALQDRLKLNADTQSPGKITKSDLGKTFANMTPKSAATVLLQMQSITPNKVLDIFNAMDTANRSKVLSALADLSKETAASISAKLAP